MMMVQGGGGHESFSCVDMFAVVGDGDGADARELVRHGTYSAWRGSSWR